MPPLQVQDCDEISFISTSGNSIYWDVVELWQPKESEWCWYGFELVEVIDVNNDHIKITRQRSDSFEEVSLAVLEPFTGELPTSVKDKQ
jgi:hypothetical protein